MDGTTPRQLTEAAEMMNCTNKTNTSQLIFVLLASLFNAAALLGGCSDVPCTEYKESELARVSSSRNRLFWGTKGGRGIRGGTKLANGSRCPPNKSPKDAALCGRPPTRSASPRASADDPGDLHKGTDGIRGGSPHRPPLAARTSPPQASEGKELHYAGAWEKMG